jgi:hypothetical protein
MDIHVLDHHRYIELFDEYTTSKCDGSFFKNFESVFKAYHTEALVF